MGITSDRFKRKHGSEWVEWLSDNPPPAEVRATALPGPGQPESAVRPPAPGQEGSLRQQRLRQAGGTYQPAFAEPTAESGAAPAVSIQISLPEFHLPKVHLPYKRIVRWAAIVVVAVALCGAAAVAVKSTLLGGSKKPGTGGSADAPSTTPAFTVVAPSDKPELAKGNSDSTAYDASHQVYSFSDTFLGGKITVSQQSLPDKLKQDKGALSGVAGGIGASTSFQTAFGTAYVATSANRTSQRLVFERGNLLMFIESEKTHDNDAWKTYIESLR